MSGIALAPHSSFRLPTVHSYADLVDYLFHALRTLHTHTSSDAQPPRTVHATFIAIRDRPAMKYSTELSPHLTTALDRKELLKIAFLTAGDRGALSDPLLRRRIMRGSNATTPSGRKERECPYRADLSTSTILTRFRGVRLYSVRYFWRRRPWLTMRQLQWPLLTN